MGGNIRNAYKGLDTYSYTCERCGREFETIHTGATYCSDCEEEIRDVDDVETEVNLKVDVDERQVVVTVALVNTGPVKNYIDVEDLGTIAENSKTPFGAGLGMLRVENEDESAVFEAPVVRRVMMLKDAKGIKDQTSQEIVWNGGDLVVHDGRRTREPKPEDMVIQRGDLLDSEELTAVFLPYDTALDSMEVTEPVPDYMIDL